MQDTPLISIVIPLYNEEEIFPKLIARLNALLDSLTQEIEVVLVNDGSKDATASLMHALALTNKCYSAVFLSRNYGHQIAVSAGISVAKGSEAVFVIDGDLQDPPELLSDFYDKMKEGYDVVYGIRKKRKEGIIKKAAYFAFYRILNAISYIQLPIDSGDFCIMSRRVVDIIKTMPEESRYIRGMRTWVGFNQTGLEYERAERAAGEPKYDFKMLFQLAYNGIFNFSEYPIKLVSRLGLFGITISLVYLIYSIIGRLFTDDVPVGFTGLLFMIIFLGGLQLLSIGILGEYIIRIFFQVKQRPLFLIEKKIINKEIVNE